MQKHIPGHYCSKSRHFPFLSWVKTDITSLFRIISYLRRQTCPVVSTVTKDTLQSLKGQNDGVVNGYYSTKGKELQSAFHTIAESLRDKFALGITFDDPIAREEQAHIPSIVIYKKVKERKIFLETTYDPGAMRSIIKTAARHLVVEFLLVLHGRCFKVRTCAHCVWDI
jgi:hypothetical protein